jgi:cytochrome b
MDAPGQGDATIRVWDPLVRVFHWALAASFLGAFLVERPRDLHETLGYVALGAVAIRLVWGFVGSAHARFADFVPSPGGLFRYLGAAIQGREARFLGHNPAGGAMVVALLAMVALTATSGWLMGTDRFFGENWLEDLHQGSANVGLTLVGLHLAGVVWESWRHRENLVAAMFTGRKRV